MSIDKLYEKLIYLSLTFLLFFITTAWEKMLFFSCGFNDANYFSRVFRKYKGKPPSAMKY